MANLKTYEVEVRHVEYGLVMVKAKDEQDAILKVRNARHQAQLVDAWVSLEFEPLLARIKGQQSNLDYDLSHLTP